jgi:hypothetical protein
VIQKLSHIDKVISLNYQNILFIVVWLIAVDIKFTGYSVRNVYSAELLHVCNNYEFKGPVRVFVCVVIESDDCITL